jgi:hypothetical protein
MLTVTLVSLGPILKFTSSTKLLIKETTLLLLIIYIISRLALASSKTFSGSLVVRNDKKLAYILLVFTLAFIII